MTRLALREIERASPDNRVRALACLDLLGGDLTDEAAADYRAAAVVYAQLHLAEVLERCMQPAFMTMTTREG